MSLMVIILSVILASVAYFYFIKNSGYLESLSLPFLKSKWIFGGPPFSYSNKVSHLYFDECFKRFEKKTFVRYRGIIPAIHTMDPDIIKEVCLNTTEFFAKPDIMNFKDKYQVLPIIGGKRWEVLRKKMSPLFTPGNLKQMVPIMRDEALIGVENIKVEEPFNPTDLIQNYACNNITSFLVPYALSSEMKSYILNNALQVLDMFKFKNYFHDAIFLLSHLFPSFSEYLPTLGPSFDAITKVVETEAKNVEFSQLEKRNSFIEKLNDMLKDIDKYPILNRDVVKAQGTMFFVAGIETASSSLVSLIYLLATHPEVQEKLYQDIISHKNEEDMTYLNAVISEQLRILPPILQIARCCTKSTTIKGIKIRKGTLVHMHIYSLHRSSEYFAQPNKFNPERFLFENQIQPYTYLPFGLGPKYCMGKKFALLEIKLFIREFLRHFKIQRHEDKDLIYTNGCFSFLGFEDYKVQFVPREPETIS